MLKRLSQLTLPAECIVQGLCNGRVSVRPSVRPSARLSVPSIAAVFRSLSAAGARAQQQLCCGAGAGAARYRSISARARAAAAGSVMLRAEVRRLNTDLFVVTLITGY